MVIIRMVHFSANTWNDCLLHNKQIMHEIANKSEFPFDALYNLCTCVFYSLALVLPEYNLHYIQANLGDIKQAMCEYKWLFGVVLVYHFSAPQ